MVAEGRDAVALLVAGGALEYSVIGREAIAKCADACIRLCQHQETWPLIDGGGTFVRATARRAAATALDIYFNSAFIFRDQYKMPIAINCHESLPIVI